MGTGMPLPVVPNGNSKGVLLDGGSFPENTFRGGGRR